uniref:C-C motif chemokine 27a n=1 Tax=Semicossyphus pulcher TaxID=241346 RepID=UPI0037E92263
MMDLKVLFVTVCLCAFALTSTDAAIPKCCINTKSKISLNVLWKVTRWDMQESNGACDIHALILYVQDSRRPICANPKLKSALMRVQKWKRHNKL